MESSPATSPPTARRRSFISRLVSTVVLWGVVLLAIWWQSQFLFLCLAFVVGMVGVLEYFRLFSHDQPDRACALLGIGIGLGWWTCTLAGAALHQGTTPPIFQSPLGWHDVAALVIAVQGSFLLTYRNGLEGAATLNRISPPCLG